MIRLLKGRTALSTPADTRDRTPAQNLINGITLWSSPSAEEKKPFCDAYRPARPMLRSKMFRMNILPGKLIRLSLCRIQFDYIRLERRIS
jgi:hypothetical protein